MADTPKKEFHHLSYKQIREAIKFHSDVQEKIVTSLLDIINDLRAANEELQIKIDPRIAPSVKDLTLEDIKVDLLGSDPRRNGKIEMNPAVSYKQLTDMMRKAVSYPFKGGKTVHKDDGLDLRITKKVPKSKRELVLHEINPVAFDTFMRNLDRALRYYAENYVDTDANRAQIIETYANEINRVLADAAQQGVIDSRLIFSIVSYYAAHVLDLVSYIPKAGEKNKSVGYTIEADDYETLLGEGSFEANIRARLAEAEEKLRKSKAGSKTRLDAVKTIQGLNDRLQKRQINTNELARDIIKFVTSENEKKIVEKKSTKAGKEVFERFDAMLKQRSTVEQQALTDALDKFKAAFNKARREAAQQAQQ